MRIRFLLFFIIIIYSFDGMGQEYFFVFLNTNPDRPELPKEKVDSLQAGHIKNIERLAVLKKIIVAGPFDGGGGIFIFKTANEEETWQYLKTDPAISANRFILEVYPYKPIKGGICEIASDAKMVTYSFIRIDPGSAEDKMKQDVTEKLLATNKFFAAGDMGVGRPSILLSSDPESNQIAKETVSGSLKLTVKALWVGKGSFCEK